jgi:hypothetical protein
VDTGADTRKPPQQQATQATPRRELRRAWTSPAERGAAEITEELISRNFVKPCDGLEPSTPSLTSSDEVGTAGKGGKPRKKKESPGDE